MTDDAPPLPEQPVPNLVPIGRASSAASTAFCATKAHGPGGYIWIDGNQKITRNNGTYDDPRPNAFSLLAGNGDRGDEIGHEREHCPGSTPTCRAACYVHGLAKHAGTTYALYDHNSRVIREVLAGPFEIAEDWARKIGAWITENAAAGFRWHVSGDVYSVGYARWIAAVCRASPKVDHWIYTRSFDRVEPLVAVSRGRGGNLALNFSCDADNYQAAREYRDRLAAHPYRPEDAPRLCYLTRGGLVPDDLPEGSVIFPDYPLRAGKQPTAVEQRANSPFWQSLSSGQRQMVCPVDFYGKSEGNRCGPCGKCLT